MNNKGQLIGQLMDKNGLSSNSTIEQYIGKVLDKYVITEPLGKGGMGLVFKAEQSMVKRSVALKLLPMTTIIDDSALKRLEREATAMGNLKHAHIATLFDFGVSSEGQPYLVMELIDGFSLKQLLQEQGRLDPARAVDILVQVSEAIDYAHARGVIHRDLKPDNIMITADPRPDYVKVLDFGIAKTLDCSVALTRTGQMVGSPYYMSPEQCTGKGVVDFRSDIYSFGVLMYECLTGNVPVKGSTFLETIWRKTTEQPAPFPDDLNQYKELEQLTFKCLAVEADNRPASMGQVTNELMQAKSAQAPCVIPAPNFGTATEAQVNQPSLQQPITEGSNQDTTAGLSSETSISSEQPKSQTRSNRWPARATPILVAITAVVGLVGGLALAMFWNGSERPVDDATKPSQGQTSHMDTMMTNHVAPSTKQSDDKAALKAIPKTSKNQRTASNLSRSTKSQAPRSKRKREKKAPSTYVTPTYGQEAAVPLAPPIVAPVNSRQDNQWRQNRWSQQVDRTSNDNNWGGSSKRNWNRQKDDTKEDRKRREENSREDNKRWEENQREEQKRSEERNRESRKKEEERSREDRKKMFEKGW